MATTDTTATVASHCDAGDHDIVGDVYEARTGNWLLPGDMVCVMLACADHAPLLGAHTRAWWERWLVTDAPATATTAFREPKGSAQCRPLRRGTREPPGLRPGGSP